MLKYVPSGQQLPFLVVLSFAFEHQTDSSTLLYVFNGGVVVAVVAVVVAAIAAVIVLQEPARCAIRIAIAVQPIHAYRHRTQCSEAVAARVQQWQTCDTRAVVADGVTAATATSHFTDYTLHASNTPAPVQISPFRQHNNTAAR